MRILLPFKIKDIGGTSTFAAKFSQRLESSGHTVIYTAQNDFDLLFIIADCPLWLVLYAKMARKKIVQRLDGVYHRATSAGAWYPLYNLKMHIIHRFFADSIIYQSQFSQRSANRFLGRPRTNNIFTIYNGVDVDAIPLRNASSDRANSLTRLLAFAQFRRRDQIEPILESAKQLDPGKFSLDIYGSYTPDLEYLFQDLPTNIVFCGKKDNLGLLRILKDYDLFLFSDQSACPNSVLEAMAAGLPVIAFERGSIPELVKSGYNGITVPVTTSSDEFSDNYPFTTTQYAAFAAAISEAADANDQLSRNARAKAESEYTLSSMTDQYERLFSN